MRKVFCLLLAVLMLFSCAALAEGQTVEVLQDTPDNFFSSLMQNLGTENWEELPGIVKGRVDSINWSGLQEKLANIDWAGILESIKSFFTEGEWTNIGEKVTGLFDKLKDLGLSSIGDITGLLGGLDLSSITNLDLSSLDFSSILSSLTGGLGDALGGMSEGLGGALGTVTDALSTLGE